MQQPAPDNLYDYSAPRPYAWKTDEFQTQTEARPTGQGGLARDTDHTGQAFSPGPLSYQPSNHLRQAFRCPHCMSQFQPRVERRVSTAGWITFAVLLVFFFPLFWIGLLIKEDVKVCQSCNRKIG
ncbi:MAG: LITAF-like zinc ribbon domain-containing protein [Pyrinomonadaceae bacterium]